MKDLFYNSVGFNTCCIEVSAHTQIIKLYYHLHDNPVQHLWQEAHSTYGKLKTNLSSGLTADDFLNFHNNVSDWYVPNHQCKFKWNKNVLGADVTVNNISFFNSDLFYSQLMKHSKLDSLINV